MKTLSHRTLSSVLALAIGVGILMLACADQVKAMPGDKTGGSTQVLAVVNGESVTDADVRGNAAAQLTQLERDYEQKKHQLLQSQLEQMIEDRLLEVEAAALGVTKERILADLKPAVVTDAAVDAFYEENKAQIPQPKDQVLPQIKKYLEQRGQLEARKKFFADLGNKHKVEIKLEPMRVEVAAAGPAKGPATAPVTIVEFSDFQCPFCSRLVPTLDQVKTKYGDKVRVVYRQFPLAMHAQARKAAEASLCANDQGKFWEMHDAMFKSQQQLAIENLKTMAIELSLNDEKFNFCLDSGKHASKVAEDLQAGTAAGVSGTPALFINGRFINGVVPLEQITEVVDDELRRKDLPSVGVASQTIVSPAGADTIKAIGDEVQWTEYHDIESDDCISIIFVGAVCHHVTYKFEFRGRIASINHQHKEYNVSLTSRKVIPQELVSPMYWSYKDRAQQWAGHESDRSRHLLARLAKLFNIALIAPVSTS